MTLFEFLNELYDKDYNPDFITNKCYYKNMLNMKK